MRTGWAYVANPRPITVRMKRGRTQLPLAIPPAVPLLGRRLTGKRFNYPNFTITCFTSV